MWGVPCTDSLSSIYKREVEVDLLAVPTKYRRKMRILVGKGTTSSEINFICNLVRVHFWDHKEKRFKNKYSWIVLEQFTLIFSVPSLIYSYLPWCDASEYIYWERAIWWALCYTLIRNISDKHKNLKIIPSSVQRGWGPGQLGSLSQGKSKLPSPRLPDSVAYLCSALSLRLFSPVSQVNRPAVCLCFPQRMNPRGTQGNDCLKLLTLK